MAGNPRQGWPFLSSTVLQVYHMGTDTMTAGEHITYSWNIQSSQHLQDCLAEKEGLSHGGVKQGPINGNDRWINFGSI